MSYDIMFLRCPPGLTADEVIEWFDSYEEPDDIDGDAELSDDDHAIWGRISRRAGQLYVDAADEVSREHAELTWESGVLVEFWPDEASVSVPYWYTGDEADVVMTIVYTIARIIEEESGRTGFDLPLGMVFSPAALDLAQQKYQRTAVLTQSLRGGETP